MFIIWGETDSERKIGVVADACRRCGKTTTLDLSVVRRGPHVNGIPTGRGRTIMTIVTCHECGRRKRFDRKAYRDFVEEEESLEMSLEDILRETNPSLAQHVAEGTRLERAVRGLSASDQITSAGIDRGSADVPLALASFASATSDPTGAVRALALHRLGLLGTNRKETNRLIVRMVSWDQLAPIDRSELMLDIDDFVNREQQGTSVARLMRWLLLRFAKAKLNWILHIAVFLVVAIVAGCVFGYLGVGDTIRRLLKTTDKPDVWPVLLGAACGAAVAFCVSLPCDLHRIRGARRRMFLEEFLPEVKKRGIEIDGVLDWISSLEHARHVTVEERRLAYARPLLEEAIRESESSGPT
jgi:hypothetical protein